MAKIYLTAGHQVIDGKGNGAHGFGDEAVEARKIMTRVTEILRERGVTVLNDLPADPLSKVINWLSSVVTEKDIVCEIHFNAAASQQANGTEVRSPEKHTVTELNLAKELATQISVALGTRLRNGKIIYSGVKSESETARGTIGILNKPWRAHNVLIETCFITNYDEMTSKYSKNFNEMCFKIAEVLYHYAVLR